MSKQDSGILGELEAAKYLRKKGYEILSANYRTRMGEIDIIAQQGPYIVFVEVKARSQGAIDTPGASVTPRKQRRVTLAALSYLSSYGMELQPRFDVVEVFLSEGRRGAPRINHIENAFTLEDGYAPF